MLSIGNFGTGIDMEDSGVCNRPVPKVRMKKTVSDTGAGTHSPAATLPPGASISEDREDLRANSPSLAAAHPRPALRPAAAHGPPPPVQKRTRSVSSLGGGEHRAPTTTTATATTIANTSHASPDITTSYEIPTSSGKQRPKPPRPPPPLPALIQKYTKQGSKLSASDKGNIPSPAMHSSKPPSTLARVQNTTATPEVPSDDRGGVHDYEDMDKFLSTQQREEKGRKSPDTVVKTSTLPQHKGNEGDAPVLPPRSIPVKKRPKVSILARSSSSSSQPEKPEKPVPYKPQCDGGSGDQGGGEYSEIKDEDYTDMRPVTSEHSPKAQGKSLSEVLCSC